MKLNFTLLLCIFIIPTVLAQKPAGIVVKTEIKPAIDGVIDETVWDKANVYSIETPFEGETPTLGSEDETNWRAMWDADGIYVFIKVTDDVFVPNFSNTGAGYMYDFPEICFDVNSLLDDGFGPQEGKGHYQIATKILEADVTGVPKTETDGVVTAFLVDNSNYTAEYFIPFSKLLNVDGARFDKTQEIGFDVYVVDNDNTLDLNDPIRNRAVWVNTGSVAEAWDNMDNCGVIALEGAGAPILVNAINLTSPAESITSDGQTLQLGIEILPADASDKGLKWLVTRDDGEIARVIISPEGLITPLVDEVITIKAFSIDGLVSSIEVKIIINGQKPTLERMSYIKNGNFNEVALNGAPLKWEGFEAGTANVFDGLLQFAPYNVRTNIYDYKMLQIVNVPYNLKDLDYVLSFKAWADEERSFQLKIEDSNNGWSTYGISSDATSDGSTFWPAGLMTITAEPTVYELHMNFANMAENCSQNFNWQVGESTTIIYLDSVSLVSVEDLNLIKAANTAVQDYKKVADFKIYPNPVVDKLHIELSTFNTNVTIFNSAGIKIEEKLVNGNNYTFNVSSYADGIYFVKANNRAVKFVK